MTSTLRFRALLPSLALALIACGGIPDSTGTPPEQLESITLKNNSPPGVLSLTGLLDVSGAERDFSVRITDIASGELNFEVHTPGLSDLKTITPSGMVTATLNDTDGWSEAARSIILTDDAGPLYVADAGSGVDRDALFGEGFVTWGEPVATVVSRLGPEGTSEYQEKAFTPAVFQTDDGAVSLLPGEVGNLRLDGKLYRAVVIASFTIDLHVEQELGCNDVSTLSYELLRVPEKPAALKITRPEAFPPAALGCM